MADIVDDDNEPPTSSVSTSTAGMTITSGSSTTSSGRHLGQRFHYLGDSQFEITTSLKGYNYQVVILSVQIDFYVGRCLKNFNHKTALKSCRIEYNKINIASYHQVFGC